MRRLIMAALLALSAGAARAGGPFDGTWVDDLATHTGVSHVDVYRVANGAYRCDSDTPPRAYPADGVGRPVPGDAEVITESVAVVGPRSIVTRIVSADMVRETTMTVSADDRTATYVALDRWPGRPDRLKTVYLAERVAPTPPGAHPVSGSWRGLRYVEVPEPYRSVTFQQKDGEISRATFRHGHYTATLGGPAVALLGADEDKLSVAIRQADPRTLVETVMVGGKPATERTYQLSGDGQAMETTVKLLGSGEVFHSIAHRKP